jgi:hypothetical protein
VFVASQFGDGVEHATRPATAVEHHDGGSEQPQLVTQRHTHPSLARVNGQDASGQGFGSWDLGFGIWVWGTASHRLTADC